MLSSSSPASVGESIATLKQPALRSLALLASQGQLLNGAGSAKPALREKIRAEVAQIGTADLRKHAIDLVAQNTDGAAHPGHSGNRRAIERRAADEDEARPEA